jgi:cytidylate kinase
MAVIAMTREMGSLGKDVATGLADQLGLKVIHHELVEHDLAERLQVAESAVHHYLEGGASLFERWKIDKQKLSRYTAEEILELAQEGNVIIRGWGATGVLRHIPNVLRVRICAPMHFRERVMMERLGLEDASAARREIERNDAAHAATMRGFFSVDWQNPLLYHMVLNTATLPVEICVNVVRLLAESPAFQETQETRSALADKLVELRVRGALSGRVGSTISPIEITASEGRVTLTGTIMGLTPNVEELVRGVPGVSEIDNRIMVVRTSSGY